MSPSIMFVDSTDTRANTATAAITNHHHKLHRSPIPMIAFHLLRLPPNSPSSTTHPAYLIRIGNMKEESR
jgi:hypothetical protein